MTAGASQPSNTTSRTNRSSRIKITAAEEADEDGVYAYNYTAAPIYDSSLGTAGFQVRVVNTVTAL